ncbi:MAG TPA: GcrA family cell cycle regulator, partial [Sphingomonas sp.]
MAWTDERIDTLKTMWENGMTASQIAEKLGGVSRNAVIGKAHRLGLQSRPSPVKPNETEEKPAPKAAAPKPAPAPAPKPVEPRPAPQAQQPSAEPKAAAPEPVAEREPQVVLRSVGP